VGWARFFWALRLGLGSGLAQAQVGLGLRLGLGSGWARAQVGLGLRLGSGSGWTQARASYLKACSILGLKNLLNKLGLSCARDLLLT
jgi:hypothetical protein